MDAAAALSVEALGLDSADAGEGPGAAAGGWDMALDGAVLCQRTVCLSPTTGDRAWPGQSGQPAPAATRTATSSGRRAGEAHGVEVALGWVSAADKIAHLERTPHLPDCTQSQHHLI